MYAATTLFLGLATLSFATATLQPRQANIAACDTSRQQIVLALSKMGDAVPAISDADVQAAAQAGLDQANAGVALVADSLLAGETPSAEGRDEVEAGLTALSAALDGADG